MSLDDLFQEAEFRVFIGPDGYLMADSYFQAGWKKFRDDWGRFIACVEDNIQEEDPSSIEWESVRKDFESEFE